MASARSYILFGVVLCLGSPAVWAQSVTVNTSLTLTGLTITASDATVNFTTPVAGSTDAQAQDSTGGNDSETTYAATAYANASGAAFLSPAGGLVTANVALPDPFVGYASSYSDSYLSGIFTITGVTGPVNVTFSASLSNSQSLSTDANGLSAFSETTYSLDLPDYSSSPILFYGSPSSIGPSTSVVIGNDPSPTQSTTILLTAGTPYYLFSSLDAEANGYGALTVPDGSDPIALVLVALGLSAAFCGLITRKPRPAERG